MDIDECIKMKKELYILLLDFLDDISDSEEKYQALIKILDNQCLNDDQVKDLFKLISKIESYHYLNSNFYDQLNRLFHYITHKQKVTIPSIEIFQIFESNRKILFLLLEKKYIIPDESIIRIIFKKRDKQGHKISFFLYPFIKDIIGKRKRKNIEYKISTRYKESIESIQKYKEKCIEGANDSYICTLIRQDSIKDFISYVNQINLPLLNLIPKSIFETKLIFIENTPTIIEYATYFGAIQIIK